MTTPLISTLVPIVRQKLKEQQAQSKPHLSIEQILNDTGIHSVSPQVMAEIRAEIYAHLGLGVCLPGTLKKQLQGFIFDHAVFRSSELRYYFPGDNEKDLFINLNQLGYVAKELPAVDEPVWRPKFMQKKTVKKQLQRDRIGNKEYLAYLFYKPPQLTENIIKH